MALRYAVARAVHLGKITVGLAPAPKPRARGALDFFDACQKKLTPGHVL